LDEDGNYLYRYYAPKLVTVELTNAEAIGRDAFGYCRELTSVILGNGITKIPEGAFRYCEKLSEINLSCITEIGDYAFNRAALTTLDLDAAVKIGEFAFLEANALASVTFSESIEKLSEGAFAYCKLLSAVNGLAYVEYIGDYAFAYTALTEADLTGAFSLGAHAFMKEKSDGCNFTVKLGTLLAEIGDNPFVYCDLEPFSIILNETFNGKDYEKTVYTFNYGENVRIIDGSLYRVVPDGLELIYYCDMSSTANVADGTVRIGAFAFCNSEAENVILPYTVKAIGHKAFYDCGKLSLVNFASFKAPILEEEYDVYYFYEGTNMPTDPKYDTELGVSGLGIVDFFMWNVTGDPTNIFYGASFVDYVGKVSNKLIMIRPSNGVGYDSFIFEQYFNLILEGKNAADDTTLAAIAAINKLPDKVSLSDKELIETARAAYNKISLNEQKVLVTNYEKLATAERRIEDLEFLSKPSEPENPSGPENPGGDENLANSKGLPAYVIILIVAGSTVALAGIGTGVFFVIKKRRATNAETPEQE